MIGIYAPVFFYVAKEKAIEMADVVHGLGPPTAPSKSSPLVCRETLEQAHLLLSFIIGGVAKDPFLLKQQFIAWVGLSENQYHWYQAPERTVRIVLLAFFLSFFVVCDLPCAKSLLHFFVWRRPW